MPQKAAPTNRFHMAAPPEPRVTAAPEIAGISIRRSNNLPFDAGVVARVDGENNDYSGDFTGHCGLIYQRDAAAVVQAIGPSVQTTGGDVKAMYQGDLIIGRLAMGADWLNPAAAIELQAV